MVNKGIRDTVGEKKNLLVTGHVVTKKRQEAVWIKKWRCLE